MTTIVQHLQIQSTLKDAFFDLAKDLVNAQTDLASAKADFVLAKADLVIARERAKTMCLTSAGLRIKGASASAIVQAHTVIYAVCGGTLVTKALDTDMAALVGTVTAAKFNVFVHFIDSAGTLTTLMGTEAATLAAVVWPAIAAGKAVLGVTIINPTGVGNFVGGTTALDDATVIPNAVFVNTVAGFDPTTALGTAATLSTATLTTATLNLQKA